MWDYGKDMIMQVDGVYLVCPTHYVYDMLISQIKGCDKRKFSSKPKYIMIMFIQRVNLL